MRWLPKAFIPPSKHCKFCASVLRACLQATEKGVPRTIESEGAPIAAAARCCMPPLLLLLPAACAHCWRMTATIARRCHLVWVLHVHVSRSADLCRSTAGAATCGQPAPVMHGLHARTRTRNTRSLYSQLMSGRGTPAKPSALSRVDVNAHFAQSIEDVERDDRK